MSLTTRSAIAAAVTAAVVFGVTAPAASAAPQEKPGHVKVAKSKVAKSDGIRVAKPEKPGQQVRLDKIRTNVLRQAAGIQAAVVANEPLVVGNLEAAAANVEAAVAVAAAITKIEALASTNLKADLRAVRAQLRNARVALEAVAAALVVAPDAPVEEPVV